MRLRLRQKVHKRLRAVFPAKKILALLIVTPILFNYLAPIGVYAMEELDTSVFEDSDLSQEEVQDTNEMSDLLEGNDLGEGEEAGLDKDVRINYEEEEEGEEGENMGEDPAPTDVEEEDDLEESVESEGAKEVWQKNLDGSYETVVEKNIEYVIDEFDSLKIVFTILPPLSGKLYVREVVAPEFIDGARVVGRSFDITTDMEDGTFEYILYLPRPEGTEGEKLDIKYTEDGVGYHDLQGEIADDLYLVTPRIDHFTTFFVVSNPTPPPVSFLEMVIDNTEPEFSIVAGTWSESTSAPNYYGTNYRISNSTGSEAQWIFQVFSSGNYGIYAWWPEGLSPPSTADYTINYQGGNGVVTKNQQNNGGNWNLLGTYPFASGVIYSVHLSNNCAAPSCNVAADAVKIRSTQAPSQVWVDDDCVGTLDGTDMGTGRIYGYNAFATVQGGIDAVADSGIVHVAGGTYEEQIEIAKDLTLSGAGAGLTTILSPTSLVNKFTTTEDNYPIVYVTGVSNVTIEDLTIDGSGRGNLNNRFYGIAFRNAGGTVQGLSILDIREEPLASVYANHGVSIYIFNDDGLVRNANILGCQFSNYQKNALAIDGDVYANISGNTITGIGPTDLVVQNGIQVYFGASGVISGNTISGNEYTTDKIAVGLLLLNIGPGMVISGNDIYSNEAGVWNYEFSMVGTTSPITAHHNNFYNNGYNALDDRADSSWDDGSEGNSWDDYLGIDLNMDGVGDTQIPYPIINTYGVVTTGDNYPLTSNYLTPPAITAPPHDPAMNPVSIPAIEWGSADGTFPPFEYQIQGFSDPSYTALSWDSLWINTLSFPLTGISDGTYYLRVRARDMYGNISYWSNDSANPYIITLDNTPPVTDDPLLEPASPSYWNSIIPIAGRSTDFFGVDFIDIYYNVSGSSDPWVHLETLDNPTDSPLFMWVSSWDPGGGPLEGTYDICAVATDIVGNEESTGCAYNVTYDITPPDVDITDPLNDATVGGTVTVAGTIDEEYFDHYELRIYPSGDPPSDPIVGCDTANPIVSCDFDSTSFDDGEHVIDLRGFDLAGNYGVDTIIITIDNTKPYVFPILGDQTFSEGDNIVVDIIGNDDVGLSNLCYQIEGGGFICLPITEATCLSDHTQCVWNLELTAIDPSLLQDGEYTLDYYLLDASTPPNQSDADEDFLNGDQPYSAIFKVENIPPLVTLQQNQTIDEGQAASFSGGFTDPSFVMGSPNNPDDAPWTAYVDYGDGSGVREIGTYNVPGGIAIPDHTYKYNGIYTVRLTVRENGNPPGDGESGFSEVAVVVNNVALFVTINAVPGIIVDEGTQVTLFANVFGGNAPFTYRWTGACLSTQKTAIVPTEAGNYTCYVSVWDADGDVSRAFINISILTPIVEEEEESTKSVLSALDCEQKSKVWGYVFDDDNDNNLKDEGEEGVEDILIEIFWGESGDRSVIASSRTNKEGYWEVELCPGEYSAGIDTETLSENLEMEWGNFIAISVEEGKEVKDVNFPVKIHDSIFDNFSLLWCVVPLLVLVLAGGVLFYLNYKKEK